MRKKETASILSPKQRKLLTLAGADPHIAKYFYLTGGTALAEFYLRHRYSEDLDFFSEREFEPQGISVFFKKIQKEASIRRVEYEQSFNRNLFFLALKGGETIKTEFTYFPFPRIEKKLKIGGLWVDSLLDIAVNKLFTIYQRPRSRDFIDLYCIMRKENSIRLDGLIEKAQIKFDHHLDPVQLGAQYMKAMTLKDYPRMIEKMNPSVWQKFFIDEAKKLSPKVLK